MCDYMYTEYPMNVYQSFDGYSLAYFECKMLYKHWSKFQPLRSHPINHYPSVPVFHTTVLEHLLHLSLNQYSLTATVLNQQRTASN
jgi:hypothetical protein